jgi:hypothetical protein
MTIMGLMGGITDHISQQRTHGDAKTQLQGIVILTVGITVKRRMIGWPGINPMVAFHTVPGYIHPPFGKDPSMIGDMKLPVVSIFMAIIRISVGDARV